jgi:hypothetical protein
MQAYLEEAEVVFRSHRKEYLARSHAYREVLGNRHSSAFYDHIHQAVYYALA